MPLGAGRHLVCPFDRNGRFFPSSRALVRLPEIPARAPGGTGHPPLSQPHVCSLTKPRPFVCLASLCLQAPRSRWPLAPVSG